MCDLPITVAPAANRRATAGAWDPAGVASARNAGVPAPVANPATSMRSLTTIGMWRSGPSAAPVASTWGPIHETDPEDAVRVYRTNAVSPVLFAETFTDRLSDGGQMVFMTSRMGSIAENEQGGVDAYRASKSALNMLAKGYSLRHKGLTVTLMHPGWVKTDMGGADAAIDVATSIGGIFEQIGKRHGAGDLAFIDYTGRAIPW